MDIKDDDFEIVQWICWAAKEGDGFLRPLAQAAKMAEPEEYELLRPSIIRIMAKHPKDLV